MRGDVGCHTDGNAGGTIHQQIGKAAGKDAGFFPGFVEIGIPIDRVFLNIPQHFIGNPGKAGFSIPIRCRGISVHGTKITVSVYQHIPHGEVLGQAHQRIVNRLISMGMVAAQHVADACSGFPEGTV